MVCPNNALKFEMNRIKLNPELCTLCGECVKHCPFGFAKIIFDENLGREVVKGICVRCGKCLKVCPRNARFDIGRYIPHPLDYSFVLEITTPEKLKEILKGVVNK